MRKRNSIAGSPILIGAATILVSIVAVFLAYTANQGLPFVPAYELTAQVPNADALVRGNDVKIGGSRVGQVVAIRPKTWPDGRVTALIDMKLDKQIQPLPVDSVVQIRPVSPLGLKYVDIHRGISTQGYKTGTTLPVETAAAQPVQIDDFFNMFDKPTRDASSANLIEFGNALAGRGLDLNQTIRNLVPLLTNLQPVMKNLNDPKTGLAALFPALERSASLTAPVAEEQASTFRGLATTFEALSTVTSSIQAAIVGGPPALDAAIKSFPDQQKFLNDSTTLFATLVPGSQALGAAAPTLNKAVTVGVGSVQRSATILNPRLADLTTGLGTFYANPGTMLGINRLISTTAIANPLLDYITPAQTTCNYASVLLRNLGSLASDEFLGGSSNPDSGGTFLRTLGLYTGNGPNADGPWTSNSEAGNSGAPFSTGVTNWAANGPYVPGDSGVNYTHLNPIPWTGQTGQGHAVACGAGNEKWTWQYSPLDPPNPYATQVADQVSAYNGSGTRHGSTIPIPPAPPTP